MNAECHDMPIEAELNPDGSLRRASPESVGLDSDALANTIRLLDETENRVDSLMVLRHGQVVCEAWRPPHTPEKPAPLYSLSKSFVSAAIGFAVQEGKLSIDAKLVDIFAADLREEPSANLRKATIRDLLTMCCGHEREPERANNIGALYDRVGPAANDEDKTWIRSFLTQDFAREPGTYFCYNTTGTYMAAVALERAVGQNALDYLTPRLFEPLGIARPVWERAPEGSVKGGTGLFLTTEQIAKFGQFYLQKGRWNGKRLLDSAWIEESTGKRVETRRDTNSNWGQGYGYQFWRCFYNAYRADGKYGQWCVVAPDQDMTIVVTSDSMHTHPILDKTLDSILPYARANALPENSAAAARLRRAERSLRPREGESGSQLLKRTARGAKGRSISYVVYTPNGYLTSSDSFPTLYWFRDVDGDERPNAADEQTRRKCDAFFAKRPDRKAIVVIADPRQWNAKDAEERAAVFRETLVPQVEREFRCANVRACCGGQRGADEIGIERGLNVGGPSIGARRFSANV